MIWVPGRPVPWGMGRGSRRRPKPERLRVYQEKVALAWRQAERDYQVKGPVWLELRIHLSTSGRRRIDTDNIEKAVADALKNVAFGDDEYIYKVVKQKEPCAPGAEGIYFAVGPYQGPVDPRHLEWRG